MQDKVPYEVHPATFAAYQKDLMSAFNFLSQAKRDGKPLTDEQSAYLDAYSAGKHILPPYQRPNSPAKEEQALIALRSRLISPPAPYESVNYAQMIATLNKLIAVFEAEREAVARRRAERAAYRQRLLDAISLPSTERLYPEALVSRLETAQRFRAEKFTDSLVVVQAGGRRVAVPEKALMEYIKLCSSEPHYWHIDTNHLFVINGDSTRLYSSAAFVGIADADIPAPVAALDWTKALQSQDPDLYHALRFADATTAKDDVFAVIALHGNKLYASNRNRVHSVTLLDDDSHTLDAYAVPAANALHIPSKAEWNSKFGVDFYTDSGFPVGAAQDFLGEAALASFTTTQAELKAFLGVAKKLPSVTLSVHGNVTLLDAESGTQRTLQPESASGTYAIPVNPAALYSALSFCKKYDHKDDATIIEVSLCERTIRMQWKHAYRLYTCAVNRFVES